MLRYQLNPHFLFNTLNAISTLILDNRNTVANSAVTGLSEFLRYTLDQDPMKKVTVAQEVDALNLYLEIEKLRFGNRLTIEFAIDANASTMLMPSLLLQPLIENAIKYAVSPRERGGKIRIGGHVTGGMLQLEVSDDGPGMVECDAADQWSRCRHPQYVRATAGAVWRARYGAGSQYRAGSARGAVVSGGERCAAAPRERVEVERG